jgi:hypothetical protein
MYQGMSSFSLNIQINKICVLVPLDEFVNILSFNGHIHNFLGTSSY